MKVTLQYEEIFSLFRGSVESYSWLNVSTEVVGEEMIEYLHKIAALPYVRGRFLTLSFDDEMESLTFELRESIDKDYDKYFVSETVFTKGMVMFWLESKKNTELLINYAVYGKEEKVFSPSGHLTTISNVYKDAKQEHEKLLCKSDYWNNLIGGI